jgi:signal recognition particle subunit SRP54
MTPFERTHPKQINGSRRARIARGSGVTVTEVNQLLVRFGDAQKMMKSMARGGGGGLPGMPGVPGTGKRGRPQQPQRRKSKSGNPAKRAAEERAAADKAAAGRSAAAASAFGVPGTGADGAAQSDPMAGFDPNNLPKGFEKFLGKG